LDYQNHTFKKFNVKPYSTLILSIFKLFILQMILEIGRILREEWTHNGLLKSWCHVCHAYRMKIMDSKTMS